MGGRGRGSGRGMWAGSDAAAAAAATAAQQAAAWQATPHRWLAAVHAPPCAARARAGAAPEQQPPADKLVELQASIAAMEGERARDVSYQRAKQQLGMP